MVQKSIVLTVGVPMGVVCLIYHSGKLATMPYMYIPL